MSICTEMRFKCANNSRCQETPKTFSFLTVIEHLVSIHMSKKEKSLLYDYTCSCGAGFLCRPLAVSHMVSLKDTTGHKLSRNDCGDLENNHLSKELVEACKKLTKDLVKNDVLLSDSILRQFQHEAREAVRMENEETGRREVSGKKQNLLENPAAEAIPRLQADDSKTMQQNEPPMSREEHSPANGASLISALHSRLPFEDVVPTVPAAQEALQAASPPMPPYSGKFVSTRVSSNSDNDQSVGESAKNRTADEERIFEMLKYFMDPKHEWFEMIEEQALEMFDAFSKEVSDPETLAAAAIVHAGRYLKMKYLNPGEMAWYANVPKKRYDKYYRMIAEEFPIEALLLTPDERIIYDVLSYVMDPMHEAFRSIEEWAYQIYNIFSSKVDDQRHLAGAAVLRAAKDHGIRLKRRDIRYFVNARRRDLKRMKKAIRPMFPRESQHDPA